jgi:hypothetical protein
MSSVISVCVCVVVYHQIYLVKVISSHDGHQRQQSCMTVSRGWLIRLYAYN